MLSTRGWDITVAVASVVMVAAMTTLFPPSSTLRLAVAAASIVFFIVGYAAIGRAAIDPPRAPWRYPAFLAVAVIAVAVSAGAAPIMAVLQLLAYPLAWLVGDTRARGILSSAVIAVGLALGVWIGYGRTPEAALSGVTSGGFGFCLAVALGLWIQRVADYGRENARLVTELTAAQSTIEALSREQGASAERERVARDIHDTLAQTLTGLVLFAERAGRLGREGRGDAAAQAVATVEQVARDALAEARALVARTAAVPDEPAFAAALDRLVERFRAHGGPEIALATRGVISGVDRESQIVLLRCLQEALSNVVKHADAAHATVTVAVDGAGLAEATVDDDGRGFDAGIRTSGFGLDSMRDRVALAGGTIEVTSSPVRGTRVRVRLAARDAATDLGEVRA